MFPQSKSWKLSCQILQDLRDGEELREGFRAIKGSDLSDGAETSPRRMNFQCPPSMGEEEEEEGRG